MQVRIFLKKKYIVLIVSLSIFLVSGGIVFSYFNSFYIRDYFAAIGLRQSSTLFEIFGEPKSIIDSVVQYEGIEFRVSGRRSNASRDDILSVSISCPDIRLGRRNIGIGSTKEEIKRAYRSSLYASYALEGNVLLILDGFTRFQRWFTDAHVFNNDGIWLWFYFDVDNRVKRIEFNRFGPV